MLLPDLYLYPVSEGFSSILIIFWILRDNIYKFQRKILNTIRGKERVPFLIYIKLATTGASVTIPRNSLYVFRPAKIVTYMSWVSVKYLLDLILGILIVKESSCFRNF